MGAFLLAVVVIVVGVMWTRRAGGFGAGFATLLRNPVGGGNSLGQFLTGREHVGGEFEGRPVVLVVHRKRSRYQVGHLTVAMQPGSGTAGLAGDAAFIWNLVRDPEGREALSRLEKNHGFQLAFEDGWLKATWMPVGFMIGFPGRFEEGRWRTALQLMQRAVVSIESRAVSA